MDLVTRLTGSLCLSNAHTYTQPHTFGVYTLHISSPNRIRSSCTDRGHEKTGDVQKMNQRIKEFNQNKSKIINWFFLHWDQVMVCVVSCVNPGYKIRFRIHSRIRNFNQKLDSEPEFGFQHKSQKKKSNSNYSKFNLDLNWITNVDPTDLDQKI